MLSKRWTYSIHTVLNISWKPSFTHCYLVAWFWRQRGAEIWQCVLLACHHQVCAVNTAGLNLQSTGPTTTNSSWLKLGFVSVSFHCCSGVRWIYNFMSNRCHWFQCYFRGIYIATVSWLEVDSVIHQNTLNEVYNSFVLLFTLIPICYHTRLLWGLVHVWPV